MGWEQYLWPALAGLIGSVVTWILSLRRQKADIKRIEVEILEKALDTLNKKVVEPLGKRYNLLQDKYDNISKEFDDFKQAVNKRFSCRHLDTCPIMLELQRLERGGRKIYGHSERTNRQREPSGGANDKATPGARDYDGFEIKDY